MLGVGLCAGVLRSCLIHPDILSAIGRAGHGSKILIADGNFPAATTLGPNARLVHLNLAPGLLGVTQVLEVLASAIVIEQVELMEPLREGPLAMRGEPPIWTEFRKVLGAAGVKGEPAQLKRQDFYRAAQQPEVALVIQTGEQKIYANVLLTIGVVEKDSGI
jgi:L-fucose mutarotase